MHTTSRLAVCLMAIGVILSLVFCNFGRTEEAAKAAPGAAPANVQALLRQRVEVLQQLSEFAAKLFQEGRTEFPDLLAAQRELFAARLDAAGSKKERIGVCNNAISQARDLLKMSEGLKATGRISPLAVLHARAFELEAQIARAKAEAGG